MFVRTRQGIRPTPQALELIGPIKTVLQDIDTILSVAEFRPRYRRKYLHHSGN